MISVIFLLSLLGAYVLFAILKSTAVIKKAGYQAGGALAGFLLIFIMLFGSYRELANQQKIFTVNGKVKVIDGNLHRGVMVKQLSPSVLTDASGTFRLESVRRIGDMWPEIQLEGDGFYPIPIEVGKLIKENKATINDSNNRVDLKEEIVLFVLP